ncbi:hypothetical protein [Mycobacterium sp. SMC-4]|uniref:hypothetical protein n=1 Tax=Mycobacterium sp. SMC-4 TaxID=2857059 RepID=UPI003D07D450
MLKANPFRKVEDMTTDNVGATVIDLQVHSARRRARFDEAMKRHPAYLSRLAAAGDDSAEMAFHAPKSPIAPCQKQSRRIELQPL